MNKTSFYIVFILAILSAIIFYGDAPERILGNPQSIETETDATPFAVASKTTTLHYHQDGSLNYTFDASRLEHYREQEEGQNNTITLIDKPELIFYQKHQPWYVLANKGKISSENNNIELWSEVLVRHTSDEGNVTEITTEKLSIDPINKVAKTQEPVKIRSENVEIEGTGMHANFVDQTLELLSKVRGLYDPK